MGVLTAGNFIEGEYYYLKSWEIMMYLISYYWGIHREGFHVIGIVNSDTQRQSQRIVPRHQFLIEQAGRARCLRRPIATRLASKKSSQGRARISFPKLGSKRVGQTSWETKIDVILIWFNGKNERSVLLVKARALMNTLWIVHTWRIVLIHTVRRLIVRDSTSTLPRAIIRWFLFNARKKEGNIWAYTN